MLMPRTKCKLYDYNKIISYKQFSQYALLQFYCKTLYINISFPPLTNVGRYFHISDIPTPNAIC